MALEAAIDALPSVDSPSVEAIEALDALVSMAEDGEAQSLQASAGSLGSGARLLSQAHMALAAAVYSGQKQAGRSYRRTADSLLLESEAFGARSPDGRRLRSKSRSL